MRHSHSIRGSCDGEPANNADRHRSVVIIGLDPSLIDFSSPDFAAFPGLTAEKVSAGITAAEEGLRALGYDARHCLIDFGKTAEAVVTAELQKHRFDCILIGAGVRDVPSDLILFEKLINVIHEQAPDSRICFNTNPSDTLAALRRWI
jgi:hypothetical protein